MIMAKCKIRVRKPYEAGYYIESENRGTLGNEKSMKKAISLAKEEAKTHPQEFIFIMKAKKVVECVG
jgi:hypothetical protein